MLQPDKHTSALPFEVINWFHHTFGKAIKNIFTGLLLTCGILTTAQANGSPGTWTGGGGNNLWTTAANWSGSVVPTDIDDVVITLDGATVTLPYGIPITIASLALGGGSGGTETLQNPSGWYTAGSWLTVTGNVSIASDGYLNLRDTAEPEIVHGDSLTVGGTITNNGKISLQEESVITGNVFNNGTLESTSRDCIINGNMSAAATSIIEVLAGVNGYSSTLIINGNLTNGGRIKLYTQDYAIANLKINSGTFTNTGTIVDSSATFTNYGSEITTIDFDNQGTLIGKSKYALRIGESIAGTFVNSGQIHAQSSMTFSNVGTFTNSGTITIDTTKTLTLSGYSGAGTYAGSGDQFHGNGTLSLLDIVVSAASFPGLDSLDLVLSGASSLNLSDSLIIYRTLTGGTIIANGTRNQGIFTVDTLISDVINNGILSGGTITGAVTNNGTLSLSGGAITGAVTNNGALSLSGGAITGAVTNNDSLNVGSDVAITGAVTNEADAKLIISSAGLSVDGGLTNDGYLELNASGTSGSTLLTVTNGQLINNVGGTIAGATGYTGFSTYYLVADLVNHGTIESNFRLYLDGGVHINSATGTITVHPGSNSSNRIFYISNDAELTNEGTIDIDATATFYVHAGGRLVNNGDIVGEGTLSIYNGWADLGDTFIHGRAGGPRLTLNNGTVVVDSLRIEDYLTLSNSSVDSFYVDHMINTDTLVIANATILGKFENHGRATVEGTSNYISGPLTNMAGAFLGLQSASSTRLTVDSSLTNAGTLELGNIDGAVTMPV